MRSSLRDLSVANFSRYGFVSPTDRLSRLVAVFQDGQQYVFVDQASYEKLGAAVTEEIYQIMESPQYKMTREYFGDGDKESNSFIFLSEGWDSKEHLVILIHGSGVVRAGQWSRRLIMNEGLDAGSQLPFLRKCEELGWGVIVMNTNLNFYTPDKYFPVSFFLILIRTPCQTDHGSCEISNGSSPVEHGTTVWQTYVAKAKARCIAVIAHSAGGSVIAGIIENCWSTEMANRLRCVCLTDAAFKLSSAVNLTLLPPIRNWVVSIQKVVGVPVDSKGIFGEYVTCITFDALDIHSAFHCIAYLLMIRSSLQRTGKSLQRITLCAAMMAPGQLVTDWMQAENLLPFLELGDLVEFRRVVGIAKRRIYTVCSLAFNFSCHNALFSVVFNEYWRIWVEAEEVGVEYVIVFKHWGVYIGSHDDKAYITHTGTDFGDFGGPVSSSAQSLTTIKTKMTGRHQIQVKSLIALALSVSMFTANIARKSRPKIFVRCDELSIVAQGDSCRINNSLDRERRPFPPAIVVNRALLMVRCDELSIVAQGDSCRINNSLDRERRPFPPAIVVNRALLMLGSSNYNILWNNCEHFANYCRYDLRESSQV
ncbi:unnamed protein product [Gongylonema pulchrum]|uniref:LRAT domain-containing protein n=1 Tax=Gongylonema pulchrum TaxID=637853 RepID=A0A3P7MGY4_9BILA|nr:unnamed protein product [Gongylonema pulchrum]